MVKGSIRKIALRLSPLLVLVVLLEGAAWLADARLNFRHKLVRALRMMEVRNQPTLPPDDAEWPGNSIMVRSTAPPKSKLYYVGDRLIADADASGGSTLIYPGGVVADPRKSIFIVGGSAAYGYPYPYGMTMTAMLNRTLATAGYMTYNVAQVGFDSAPLVPISRRVVNHYEPDVLVVFTGNNEWVRWRPTPQAGMSAARVKLMRRLAGSRALAGLEYLLMRKFLRPANAGTGNHVSQQNLFGTTTAFQNPLDPEVFDPKLWPRIKARYLLNFRRNLEMMIRDAKEKGVRVFLCTIPIQYKLAPDWKHPQPFCYDARRDVDVPVLVERLNRLPEGEGYPVALEELERALEVDERIPILHYLLGFVLEQMGRYDHAEVSYENCREHMIGNLGSMRSVNETIRETAEENDVGLIDLKVVFDEYEHQQGAYFNIDLIHDDCHPTPLGHQIIANEIIKRLGTGTREH